MKKIVFLTGAGMSAESGISTFRDSGGLWERYPVMQVASHTGWLEDPDLVTRFYNERRRELFGTQPCGGHRLVAELEEKYDVTVVTQNVDDLHERAGSSRLYICMENCEKCVPATMWRTPNTGRCSVPIITK